MKVEYELSKQDYIDSYSYLATPNKRAFFLQRYFLPIILLITPLLLSRIIKVDFWDWKV